MDHPARAATPTPVGRRQGQDRRRSGRRSTDRLEQVVEAEPNWDVVADRPGTFGRTAEAPGHLAPRELRGTVLLVDGDPTSLAVLSRQLLGSAYRVIRAASARGALDVLGRWPVDVTIAALELEDPSGLELLGQARARRPEAIRIALTGHPDVATAISAINLEEVFRYLTKPVSRDQLLATVQLALERRRDLSTALAVAASPPPVSALDRSGARQRLAAEEPAELRMAPRSFLEPVSRPALPAWLPSAPEATGTAPPETQHLVQDHGDLAGPASW